MYPVTQLMSVHWVQPSQRQCHRSITCVSAAAAAAAAASSIQVWPWWVNNMYLRLTLMRCLLIHLVKVFFCTASRSSTAHYTLHINTLSYQQAYFSSLELFRILETISCYREIAIFNDFYSLNQWSKCAERGGTWQLPVPIGVNLYKAPRPEPPLFKV